MNFQLTNESRIVLPPRALEPVVYAARELRDYLEKISGQRLSIFPGEQPAFGDIAVGIPPVGEMVLSDGERVRIKTESGILFLAGDGTRGTLYAVYTFLEEFLGVRWYTSKVEKVPKHKQIAFQSINYTYEPPFENRDMLYFDCLNGDWAARNRLNGHFPELETRHGGKMDYAMFVHTFRELVPEEPFYREHPEYFGLWEGKRVAGPEGQLCLTNEDVYHVVLERVLQTLKERPDCKIISVSQNDNIRPCQCEACRTVDEQEQSHAGTLIRFVNRIAQEVEKVRPDVIVDTLAYQYTRKAPKLTRPRHNVCIRLCTIECCFSHPLGSCPDLYARKTVGEGGDLARDLTQWGKICDRIYVWDYVSDFHHYFFPMSNWRTLQPNLQFFRKNHVKGVFEEGANPAAQASSSFPRYSGTAEMEPCRAWLLAKLLWNPDLDFDAAMRDFMDGYFGPAAEYLYSYIQLLSAQCERHDVHCGCYQPVDPTSLTEQSPAMANLTARYGSLEKAVAHIDSLPEPLLAQCEALFDQAEKAVAGSETFSRRVHIERFALRYTRLCREHTKPGSAEAILAFRDDLMAHGIQTIREWVALDVSILSMIKEGHA